ncbi:MAG: VF530 family protein [Arcobacteraceae bacterium]
MSNQHQNNPLHGITLEMMIKELQSSLGWEQLGRKLNVNCFQKDPSVNSCLKFFRKTPWARAKLEKIYLDFKSKS